MANPFLVLGGIAISVATAAFGILQVPGWVASAQDAAATNDIAQVSAAQAAAASAGGSYARSMGFLEQHGGVQVAKSDGVRLATASDPTGKHHLTVARSASGAYFARTSERATIGRAATLEAAVTAAGTTVTGPATARVTAEGVPLPKGQMATRVYENLFQNAGAQTTDGFAAHWGEGPGWDGKTESVSAAWTHSGRAVRFTKLGTAPLDNTHFDLRPARWMEPGKTYTVVWEMVGSGTFTSPGAVHGWPHPQVAIARSPDATEVVGAQPRKVWATFTMAEHIEPHWQAYLGIRLAEGDWVEFGNAQMYEGPYDPTRPWFSGDDVAAGDLHVEWSGIPGKSSSVAYR